MLDSILSLLDVEQLRNNLVDNVTEQWTGLISFLPSLLGALIILLSGWLIALLFRRLSRSIFHRLGLDKISNKSGVSSVMDDAGFHQRPSVIASKAVYWLVLCGFMVPAANTLGMTELVALFKTFIAFMPKLAAALLLIIFGMMFAQFLRGAIANNRAMMGSQSAATLANVVYGVMVASVVLVALEQLNIRTELLHSIILIAIAGMVIAAAIALGFGGRDVAHNLLAGVYAREQFNAGSRIEIAEQSGVIVAVTNLTTQVQLDAGDVISIPNSQLYQQQITQKPG